MIWLTPIPFIFWLFVRRFYDPVLPPEDFMAWVGLLIAVGMHAALWSAPLVIVGAVLGSNVPRWGLSDKRYPLVSLKQRDGVEGVFFLGTGMLGSSQYYFWYRRDGDAIRGGKTDRCPGVRIYEEDGDPFMQTYKTAYRWKWARRWLWLVAIDIRADDKEWCEDFHIPPGSVQEGFQL